MRNPRLGHVCLQELSRNQQLPLWHQYGAAATYGAEADPSGMHGTSDMTPMSAWGSSYVQITDAQSQGVLIPTTYVTLPRNLPKGDRKLESGCCCCGMSAATFLEEHPSCMHANSDIAITAQDV